VRFPVQVAPERFDVKMLRWSQVSPQGDRVVYQALGKLWIKNLGGGEPRRLTQGEDHFEYYPAWSRDGRSIVYTTWSDKDLGSIRVVGVGGGEGRTVTKTPATTSSRRSRRTADDRLPHHLGRLPAPGIVGARDRDLRHPDGGRSADAGSPRRARCRSSAPPATGCSS
jgi:hypothetical protein